MNSTETTPISTRCSSSTSNSGIANDSKIWKGWKGLQNIQFWEKIILCTKHNPVLNSPNFIENPSTILKNPVQRKKDVQIYCKQLITR